MKSNILSIRTATPDDAAAILEIYAPYIERTAITFEYDVPSLEEFCQRIVNTLKKYPYLVAEENGEIVGYSYAGMFRPRIAYKHCVETSIYIRMDMRGRGIGRKLYEELEHQLADKGFLNINASITWLDIEDEYLTHQSPEFHEHLGYKHCAHFHKCGYKFGRWYDMIWMEKLLPRK